MSDVRLETDARGVARLVIARAGRKNAFDAELIADLTAATRRIDPAARAVLLESEGDVFCAGADVEWMRSMADYSLEQNVADSTALARTTNADRFAAQGRSVPHLD